MIAKIAYLSSPDAGRYMLNVQTFGSDDLMSVEIAPDQMRNILIDGITLWLRQSFHRVPAASQIESAHERNGRQPA